MESGVFLDMRNWTIQDGYRFMPQAYAQEIARRFYIRTQSVLFDKLGKALADYDDVAIRSVVEMMHASESIAEIDLPDAWTIAQQFEQVIKSGSRIIDTYIPAMDSALGGMERQTLTVLAARPSMGKTGLAWQIARNAAQAGSKVVFFTLEMSATSLWSRAACSAAKTTWRDVKAKKISAEKEDELLEKNYSIAMQYEDRLRIVEKDQTTETIWRAVSQFRPDLVVIDHLREIDDDMENETKRLGMITKKLKRIAKLFNTSVLCCVQLNRGAEGREDKRPMLSDMRDSGQIEENADIVLMIYRDDYYNPPFRPSTLSETEVWVRKNRDGAKDGKIVLRYNLTEQWFE